jgi:hypothetical protein
VYAGFSGNRWWHSLAWASIAPEWDLYEVVIPRTPFIAIYRIDESAEVLTIVALFHYAQDRKFR